MEAVRDDENVTCPDLFTTHWRLDINSIHRKDVVAKANMGTEVWGNPSSAGGSPLPLPVFGGWVCDDDAFAAAMKTNVDMVGVSGIRPHERE